MLVESEIKHLIELKNENKNLDYKRSFIWIPNSKDEKLELIRDILAMSNTKDGGVLIFGIDDSGFDLLGLPDHEFESADQTEVNNLLAKYSDPPTFCFVYKHVIDNKKVVTIEVPPFSKMPIMCGKGANSSKDNNKIILKKGQLYIRTDGAETRAIDTSIEMRGLIERALRNTRDELLSTINHIIRGESANPPSNFHSNYGKRLAESNKYIVDSLNPEMDANGYWQVEAYPTEYKVDRFANYEHLEESIRNATVSLRGWDVPATDSENASNFLSGRQSFTRYMHFYEAYRAGFDGSFSWRKLFWEDLLGKRSKYDSERRVIDFVHIIWQTTEILLFLKRFYEQIDASSTIYYKISLSGVDNRELASLDDRIPFIGPHVSVDSPLYFEQSLSVPELMATHKEIAVDIILNIFQLFHAKKLGKNVILDWQKRLLERRFN